MSSILHKLGVNRHTPRGVWVASRSVFFASVIVTSSIIGVRYLGWLQPLEVILFDQLMRLKPERGIDPHLLVVTITEADIQRQGHWPISDQIFAQALANLQQHQPSVIGLDVYRDLPQEPGYQALVKQLKAPNVIGIRKFGDENTQGVAPPPTIPLERIGFNDIVIDPDGVVRRNLIFITMGNEILNSFSMRLASFYLKQQGIEPKNSPQNPKFMQFGPETFVPLIPNDGGYATIDAQGYQVLLQYRSGQNLAQTVTLEQVLRQELDPRWIKGKIVLIGTTAPSGKDLFFTPYSAAAKEEPKMAGVLVQAQMVSQIVSTALGEQQLFKFWSEGVEVLWIGGWAIFGGILAWRIRHPLNLGFASGMALISLFGICWGLFLAARWIPLVPPALALMITGTGVMAYKQLHQLFHDTLTGLPNRALFLSRVERNLTSSLTDTLLRIRRPHLFAILFLDLNRFKVINDSLGHKVGDEVLVEISRRLRNCVRVTDTLARLGGDEFAILIENLKDVSNAIRVAERIHSNFLAPVKLSRQEVFMSASIGITLGERGPGEAEHFLRDAHTAMYRAKILGTVGYKVFDVTMHTSAVERLHLETDLRLAVKRQEFILHYQPLINLTTGKIMGFEALVRWLHPQRGLVAPGTFIWLAEETGLIIPIGAWVLREACRQLQIWHEQFPCDPPLIMSVNLSGKQFAQSDLMEQIQQILQASHLKPDSLKLEITESVVMDDVEAAIQLLEQMKALDIKLGIDDFGTGYSSLSYLNRFPTDTLKVDRSFVSRMETVGEGENVAIVRTIIMLAHSLKMDVIAEGVETVEQLAQLRALNCDSGQGYFFSKPVPKEVAEELLAAVPQW